MLSLPSKPWKKVKLEAIADQRYRIVFLTGADTEDAFLEAVEKDIRSSLAPGDQLGDADWASRSVTVTVRDLRTLKRNLVFACVMVEVE